MIMQKRFRMIDYVTVPFKVCPVYSALVAAHVLISAIIPAIKTLIVADLINTALEIFNRTANRDQIYMPMGLLMMLIVYGYVFDVLINLVRKKQQIKLSSVVKSDMIIKCGSLQYSYIESSELWELIKRVGSGADKIILEGFGEILGAITIIINIVSILLILVAYVWWVPIVILLFSVPLMILSTKSGKEQYEAYKESVKYQRRADYLHTVLNARENYEERSMFEYTEDMNEKWFKQFEKARKINLKVRAKSYLRRKLSGLVVLLISVCVSGTLIVPLIYDQITIGLFTSMIGTVFSFVQIMSWTIGDTVKMDCYGLFRHLH